MNHIGFTEVITHVGKVYLPIRCGRFTLIFLRESASQWNVKGVMAKDSKISLLSDKTDFVFMSWQRI